MNKLIVLVTFIIGFAFELNAQNVPEKKEPEKVEQKNPEKKEGDKTDPEKKGDKNDEKKTDKKDEKDKKQDVAVPNGPGGQSQLLRRPEKNRIRVFAGIGYGQFQPAILTGATSSWLVNSALRYAQDPSQQFPIPIEEPGKLPYFSTYGAIDYSYMDRLTVSFSYYRVDQRFSRKQPDKATFFLPSNSTYYIALFEGIRLVRFQEDRKTAEVSYMHPLRFAGFKAGGHIGREWTREVDTVSLGSYTSTRPGAPVSDQITWSEGGQIPGEYRLAGWNFGPMLRYQIFEWFGLSYKLTSFSRAGQFNLSGYQILNFNRGDGTSGLNAMAPIHYGKMTDKGTRHNLEAAFLIACRYSLHVGLMKEDFARSYSMYLGNTITPISTVQMKTQGLGIGEMSSAHPSHKIELYVRFGVHFFI